MKRLLGVLAIVLAAIGGAASGQASNDGATSTDPLQAYMRAFSSGDYMAALLAFGGQEAEAMEPSLRDSWFQFRPVLDGFVVERETLLSPSDQLAGEALERLNRLQPKDAIATIVEQARHTRIVIVNEAHDNPRDRAFVMQVAEALRPLGYTHYAAETLSNWGSQEQVSQRLRALTERSYPVFGDGYYSTDPTFGYLLRGVLALGYVPVSYEWTPGPEGFPSDRAQTVALREKAQADNLAVALTAAGPGAKFLIHVGYSHAAEEPLGGGQRWMAAQLKDLTGINPLTIDQTGLSQYVRPALHAQVAPAAGTQPVILFDGSDAVRIGANGSAMDLQIVHPPITAIGGRPDWLGRTGRNPVSVPIELMPKDGRRIVKVVVPGELRDAVPIDIVLVTAGDEPPLVYVPTDGEFDWAVQDSG
jgi:hypothetical protein